MNVFSGSLQLKPKAFGMSWHRSPAAVDDPPQPTTAAWIRSHGYGVDPYRARWSKMELQPPTSDGVHQIDFSGTDILVNYHKRFGQRVLLDLWATPQWASARPDEPSAVEPGAAAEPVDMATWEHYVGACAERYGDEVDYEIWNEPNRQWKFFSGPMTKMAEMVRVGAKIIRQLAPGAKIVSPPITNLNAHLGGADYLKALLQLDTGDGTLVRDHIDVVGVHMYAPDFDRIDMLATEIIPGVRLAMKAAGCADKPLWNTEFGQLSPGLMTMPLADRKRAVWRLLVLSLCHSMGGADRVCWYAADDGEYGFPAPEDVAFWNSTVSLLTSAPITQVDLDEHSGEVAAVIGGRHHVR